ncbi:alpha/beta hydrolase [Gorillibacterium sp. sgz5001074]|uniref:alpha/beta hydrolase n=1 Tax=Gorillibacterium sp. sgz5001074 TaxID=3446695 RepID=UPI003F675362
MKSTPRTDAAQLTGIKAFLRQTGSTGKSVEQIREEMMTAAARWPEVPGVRVTSVQVGPLYGEWLEPEEGPGAGPGENNRRKAILYLHGGGFTAGTCAFYRPLASRIALACGTPVLQVDYRLAPEHPYPAANEDALSAYRWLLKQGYAPGDIGLGGDSVGASLALMTLLALRDSGEELPAGAFLISPHADLVHLDGESYRSNAEADPTGSLEGNRQLFEAYWGGQSGEPPAILSPLRMSLAGLPPLLIQAGDQEVLLSDAERLAGRLKADGSEVTLEIWEDMWCVFHLLAHLLPEAREAVSRIGAFMRGRLETALWSV